jgi:TolB-like protein/tRNA A-37 threonylcarbamoyl transferase component Bud32
MAVGMHQAPGERYTIERELGRGGMATVFLATDTKFARRVAIKVLDPEVAAALGAERFHREIQIATHLTHPNILPIYDSGEVGGALYYVMPFVEGESLQQRIAREHQLGIDEAIRITCEVASALAYAHAAGFVHRDIKPGNILLQSGHAVVADFGIARAITSVAGAETLTRTGISLGTPAYMSPEQALGERAIDGRSDQYALACVAYEMLTGQAPFSAPTAQGLIARHVADDVPLITTVRHAVPDEVEDVILRGLEKVPADRFPTIQEFGDSLAAAWLLTSTAAMRRRTTSRTHAAHTSSGRRAKRRLTAALSRRQWTIGAAALLCGAAGVWAWDQPSRAASSSALAATLDPRRVAVLYFEDLSRDQALEPLAAGLTENLIERLDQVRTLDVVSKNGVRAFREPEIDVDSVSAVLKTGTVVRGSVDQVGDRVRVHMRLVDGNSGTEVKRRTFTRPAGDLIAVSDSLASEVAIFLRERLGEEVRLRERREATRSTEAWLLVQRADKMGRDAQELSRAGTPEDASAQLVRADSVLVLAAKADEAWAEPLVQRGQFAYRRARLNPAPASAKALMDTALAYAAEALELSPRNPKARELRGTVRYQLVNRQLEQQPARVVLLLQQAEQDLRAAVTAEPSLATAWYMLSDLYIHNEDLIQAQLAARRAYEEDAYLSAAPGILWQLFSSSYELEDFVNADHWCQEGARRFATNPQFVRCQLFLFTTPIKPPDPAAAWRLVEQWRALAPAKTWEMQGRDAHGLVAIMLARGGLADSALRVIEGSRASGAVDPNRTLLQYEAYVRLLRGERDDALRLLQQYLAVNPEIRSGMARGYSWWWKDLAKDPRFKAMIESGG